MYKVIMILAHDKAGGIAKDDKLPWNCPEDLKFFKDYIKNKTVIVSERLWNNTLSKFHDRHKAILVNSKSTMTAREHLNLRNEDVVIVGGKHVYERYAKDADMIVATKIPGDYNCDLKVDLNIFDGFLNTGSIGIANGVRAEVYQKFN